MENQIITIKETKIGNEDVNAVDARELHGFLEVKRDFTTWIKSQIVRCRLKEKRDFEVFTEKGVNPNGGRPVSLYVMSVDAAKHISMVSGTEKGFQAREYFIECEKKLKSKEKTPELDPISRDLKAAVSIAETLGLKDNQALLSANGVVKDIHGFDCMEKFNIKAFISKDQTQYFTVTVLGKKLGISAFKFNRLLQDAGMQVANRDSKDKLVWSVTDKGKPFSQLSDTRKKHSDGSPVTQIKWAESVLDKIKR